jgi:hypothetical protein
VQQSQSEGGSTKPLFTKTSKAKKRPKKYPPPCFIGACRTCGRINHATTDCNLGHHPDANREDKPWELSTNGIAWMAADKRRGTLCVFLRLNGAPFGKNTAPPGIAQKPLKSVTTSKDVTRGFKRSNTEGVIEGNKKGRPRNPTFVSLPDVAVAVIEGPTAELTSPLSHPSISTVCSLSSFLSVKNRETALKKDMGVDLSAEKDFRRARKNCVETLAFAIL